MSRFAHGNVEIAYLDEGEGDAVLLIHGFASNRQMNWVLPGWVAVLKREGRRVLALDNRGHGESTKLYDPAEYAIAKMASDAIALIDHLGLARIDVMGYSMGGRITGHLAVHHGDRLRAAVIGGMGLGLVDGGPPRDNILQAMEAPSLADVTDPVGRGFRHFAEQTKSDLKALAAVLRGYRQTLTRDQLAAIRVPVMVAVGTRDEIAGPGAPLAALIPGARLLEIPGRDHMLAVGDRAYKTGVAAFLQERA
jgi:pimeloyl-ACP methyl ester carboxylesterase